MHDRRFRRTRAATLAALVGWIAAAWLAVHLLGVAVGVLVAGWGVSIVVCAALVYGPAARRSRAHPAERAAVGAGLVRPT